jgi:hypothetical protein
LPNYTAPMNPAVLLTALSIRSGAKKTMNNTKER